MKVIKEVITDLTKASKKSVIMREDIEKCISALEEADAIIDDEISDAEETGRDEAESDFKEEKKELEEENLKLENDLDEAIKKSLPVVSIIDEMKMTPIKRMYQNLNIEQLEEVENFARSIVKHPSKYIEFIHEN